jgi:hypothetical protein
MKQVDESRAALVAGEDHVGKNVVISVQVGGAGSIPKERIRRKVNVVSCSLLNNRQNRNRGRRIEGSLGFSIYILECEECDDITDGLR